MLKKVIISAVGVGLLAMPAAAFAATTTATKSATPASATCVDKAGKQLTGKALRDCQHKEAKATTHSAMAPETKPAKSN